MWFWFKCICESVWLSVFLLVLWWTGNMPMVYPMTGQARLEGPSSQSENLCAWASICTGCFTLKFVQIVFAIPVSDFLLLPSGKKRVTDKYQNQQCIIKWSWMIIWRHNKDKLAGLETSQGWTLYEAVFLSVSKNCRGTAFSIWANMFNYFPF